MDTGKDDLINKDLHENVAKALREKYDSRVAEYEASGIDNDQKENAKHVTNTWLEVAKVAVAMLQPTAINSELPNDSRLGSGKRPLDETKDVDVGGQIDPSVPEHTKSGARK